MIWVVARKEIHENLISLRFLLLFVLAMALIPSSLYTEYRAYLARVAEQRQIEERNRDYLRQLRVSQIFTNPNFAIDVYWPPTATSVFASGYEEEHPRHLVVGQHSVEYGAPLEVRQLAGLFGAIDYLFVVQFIFSLFAVLLSFDAITREKESGTLRSMLSNSLSRATVASGKLLGGYATLAIPLLVAFMMGMAMLAAAGLNVFAGDFVARAGWILTSSLAYIAVFFALGLLVSSLVLSTYSALVISLAFWLIGVVVMPRAAALVSQLAKPVESRQAAWLAKLAAANSIEQEKGRALQELVNRVGVLDKEGRRIPGEDWQKQRSAVAAAYEERAAQAIKRIEEDYQRRKTDQRLLGLTLARLSPAGALVNFTTEMAETGIGVESRFLSEAERYREVLGRELFSRIYREVWPGGRITMGVLKPINPAGLPGFRMMPRRVQESFFGADLAILLGWLAAGVASIYGALGRYDVR